MQCFPPLQAPANAQWDSITGTTVVAPRNHPPQRIAPGVVKETAVHKSVAACCRAAVQACICHYSEEDWRDKSALAAM